MSRNGPRNVNAHCREMTAALDANPPVIVWAKDKRGVMVAVEVHDPHAERTADAQAERVRASVAKADREYQESLQQEADDTAERFRKHRAANTPLLYAARRAI